MNESRQGGSPQHAQTFPGFYDDEPGGESKKRGRKEEREKRPQKPKSRL